MKFFKIMVILFLVSQIIYSLQAQSPDLINYQAVAYNASGNSVANTAISIRITILQGSTSGPISYQETHNPGTDANGAFDLQIGGGAVASGTFAGISWGSFSHYLRVEMDISGGSSYTIMGTSQMVSVPYAKYAETAGSAGSVGTSAADVLNGAMLYMTRNCSQSNCTTNYISGVDFFHHAHKSKDANSIVIGVSEWHALNLTYNATTLAITSGSVQFSAGNGSSTVYTNFSGSIASDYNTVLVSYTATDSGGACICTDTYARQ